MSGLPPSRSMQRGKEKNEVKQKPTDRWVFVMHSFEVELLRA